MWSAFTVHTTVLIMGELSVLLTYGTFSSLLPMLIGQKVNCLCSLSSDILRRQRVLILQPFLRIIAESYEPVSPPLML